MLDRIKQIDARLEELKEYEEEINRLKIERKILQDKWDKENLSFEEKVMMYLEDYTSGKKIKHLPECQNFPNLYKWIKSRDLDRHMTVYIREWFEDLFCDLEDGNKIEENKKPFWEEIINNNIESVTIDW